MMNWWKILSVVLILYSIAAGLLGNVPDLPILEQTIRNLFFHVPMWFCMIALMVASFIYAIFSLSEKPESNKIAIQTNFSKNSLNDLHSSCFASVGMTFGIAGLLTGMIWAKNTWGAYWVADPKLNSAAIGMLLYSAYFVLRSSIDDEEKRARVSAVYNIFCLPIYLVLIFILPRLTDSLHPGNGGNPAFNSYDLDNNMRLIFYPACIGWILLGFWIAQLKFRLKKIEMSASN